MRIKNLFQNVWLLSTLAGLSAVWPASPRAAEPIPPEMQGVEINEHLGEMIPADLTFTNEAGQLVPLREFLNKDRPVILMLVYYTCPTLCNFMLNGFTDGLKELDWTPGKEFEILTVSIDPTETYPLAEAKKANYMKHYDRPEGAPGWHWFVGGQDQIKMLADAVGFKYKYDKRQKLYAHLPAVYVLTPEGIISRYLYGIEYQAKDMRLALLEASDGKIGTTLDRLIMFCYHYDPVSRKYGLFAMRLMRVGGALTAIFIVSLIGFYLYRERRRRIRKPRTEEPAAAPSA